MNNQSLPNFSSSEISLITECVKKRQDKFFVGDAVYNRLNDIITKLNELKQPQ
tara:strand:- start:403 stop:561 length:159 start_codon:yes stop_codon:yes gene_type:complete